MTTDASGNPDARSGPPDDRAPATNGHGAVSTLAADEPLARRATAAHDFATVAGRAIRGVFREPEFFIPALVVPVFFYVVNVGSLQDFAEQSGSVEDFKAFQLPVAIIFAVTGISRASALVTDIQSGYFDRLLLTPIRRAMLLLGLMAADVVSIVMLTIPVLLLGLGFGVRFETGVLGMVVFIAYGALWGLAFAGFPYAIALKTGNPAAVNASFILFFPFAFLTTTFLPQEALTGWLATIADYNPVTYVLAGLRSLVSDGWQWTPLVQGLLASLGLMLVSFTLASLTMRGRVRRQ
jgi:ABC-2 type transport system permease protein